MPRIRRGERDLLPPDTIKVLPTHFSAGKDVTGRVVLICEELQAARRDVLPVLQAARFAVQLRKAEWALNLRCLPPDIELAVLDIGSANGQGFKVCAHIRTLSPVPIMLVLRGEARSLALQSNAVIARRLSLSTQTVKNLLSALYSKLGAANRTVAVAIALQRNLRKPRPLTRYSRNNHRISRFRPALRERCYDLSESVLPIGERRCPSISS